MTWWAGFLLVLCNGMKPSMRSGDSSAEGSATGTFRRLRGVVSTPEGKVLIVGLVLAFLHMGVIALTRFYSAELFHSLLSMIGTHILGGRAAAISWGFAQNLKGWVVVVTTMNIETFLVLVFYPLFVFSYQKLIVIKPLEEPMARARRAAEAHQRTIMKYGIPGLLLFVWFPFWMTGPLVGSVIGFLIGLQLKANLAVVLAGTYLAILSWSFILHRFIDIVKPVGPYIPLFLVGIVLLLAVSIRIRYAFSHHAARTTKGEDDREEGRRP